MIMETDDATFSVRQRGDRRFNDPTPLVEHCALGWIKVCIRCGARQSRTTDIEQRLEAQPPFRLSGLIHPVDVIDRYSKPIGYSRRPCRLSCLALNASNGRRQDPLSATR